MYFERRSQVLGSRFKAKLVTAFVGFSLIPSILLFLVASGLITKSINRWFRLQVEGSLHNAQEVVDIHYQVLADQAVFFAEQIREQSEVKKAIIRKDKEALDSTLSALQKNIPWMPFNSSIMSRGKSEWPSVLRSTVTF